VKYMITLAMAELLVAISVRHLSSSFVLVKSTLRRQMDSDSSLRSLNIFCEFKYAIWWYILIGAVVIPFGVPGSPH